MTGCKLSKKELINEILSIKEMLKMDDEEFIIASRDKWGMKRKIKSERVDREKIYRALIMIELFENRLKD